MDPRDFDRRVLDAIDGIVAQVTDDALDRPTPCDGWDLDQLLRHMIGHHRGFAAAASGAEPDPQMWDGAELGPDPYGTYREAAELVTEAFSARDLLDRRMQIFGYGTFPAKVALHMHSVDFLGHGWDVARSLGVDDSLDAELCEEGLAIARSWPDSAWGPGAPFAARVPVAADAPAYRRLIGFLGRTPDWQPN